LLSCPSSPVAPLSLRLAIALVLAATAVGCGRASPGAGMGEAAPAPAAPTGDSGAAGDGGQAASSYAGPDYGACVSDAQCEPGSWCTPVPGHAQSYCAPPCDPAGDGADCGDPAALGFQPVCLENGRCAQGCDEGALAAEAQDGNLVAAAGDACPTGLECVLAAVDEDTEQPLCAGAKGGGSGFYGLCTHPNVDGSDCPDASSCFGGSYLGIEDGVCLPWCDDGSCAPVPDGVTASPLCYDVGLEHPMCVLLCVPDDSVCPDAQFCYDFGSVGICVPDGSVIDY
jgi:hypothetical protein